MPSHPFDLMVAPNGARLQKTDHPALPITRADIVATARACAAAGATSIHAHVRDAQGRHSLDPAAYQALIADIAATTDLSVQISTEAAGIFDVATQHDCLARVATRDASVALSEISRDPDGLPGTYRMAADRGISVQHILYDPSEVAALLRHFDTGTIPEQDRRVLFVLGRYTPGQRSTPADLDPFLSALGPDRLSWSVCAFGPTEQDCLLAALNAGGHVRVGFENNRTAPDGTAFADNAAAVASLVAAAARAGFAPRKVTP